MPIRPQLVLAGILGLLAPEAQARTFQVAPTDGFAAIEAAVAGDIVELGPGTYRFRVDLSNAGTPSAPITLRAQDPNNRPVWDLAATPVSAAPGSYTGGDRGRGCWQIRGGHYRIDGVVFQNCVDTSSAGIRVVDVPDVQIRNCTFSRNTNGLTGSGEGLLIEHSEFDRNGMPATAGDNAAHQIYIYGGTLAVRYSYFHDSPQGQSFHIRSRDALLEYNWFARPGSYMGDIMSCESFCGGSGVNPITQRMLLRGNVFLQGTPINRSQLIALYNDDPAGSGDGTGRVDRMELTLLFNTIIGQSGVTNAVVHSLNDSGISTAVHASGNAIVSFQTFHLAAASLANTTVDGTANWMTTATAGTTGLSGTLTGADAMLSAGNIPQTGSPLLGAAPTLGSEAPRFEYYRDETVKNQGRARASASDIGAFERNSSSIPFGPGAALPSAPDGGVSSDGGGTRDGGGGGTGDGGRTRDAGVSMSDDGGGTGSGDGGDSAGDDGGCGCRVTSRPRPGSWLTLIGLLTMGCLGARAAQRRQRSLRAGMSGLRAKY